MKYLIHSYIARPDTVIMEVVAVISGAEPVYGVISSKNPIQMLWYTEGELIRSNFKTVVVEPLKFIDVAIGDTIADGEGHYYKVLARQNDAVLLSESSDHNAKSVLDFVKHMEGHGATVMGDEAKEHLRSHASLNESHKRAGEWITIGGLAFMNYQWVRE